MTTGLPDFFKFNLWSNMRLLDACAQLTDEQLDATMNGTFGSVRDTLMHMFDSEEGYAGHFSGIYPNPRLRDFTAFPGFDELRQHAKASGEKLIHIAEHENLDRTFLLDEGTYKCPAVIVLIQAMDHGIDHRSQISTLLTQQGIEPPDLDAWSYNDDMNA